MKRVVFTFDEGAYKALMELVRKGGYPSPADAVRDALTIARAFQVQADQGYTEIIVLRPHTGQQRVASGPALAGVAATRRASNASGTGPATGAVTP